MSWWTDVRNTVESAAPVVVTIAAPELAPEIGAALGATGTTATVIGSAAIAGGTEALAGGNAQQIANAAAAGGVGSGVTSEVAPYTAPVAGAAPGSVSPWAQAAGGAASGATGAALTGQDIGKSALKGAVVGGGASLGAQEISSAFSPTYQQGATISTNALPQVGAQDTAPTTTTNEGLKIPSSVLYGQPSTATDTGTGINYNLSQNVFTPSGGIDYGFTQAIPEGTLTSEPLPSAGLTKGQQSALQDVLQFGLNTILSPKATGAGASLGSVGSTGSTAQTGATTGTSETPGGTELDPSTGKAPQLVWGDKYSSLKEGLNL
jgi:hypothetical protein